MQTIRGGMTVKTGTLDGVGEQDTTTSSRCRIQNWVPVLAADTSGKWEANKKMKEDNERYAAVDAINRGRDAEKGKAQRSLHGSVLIGEKLVTGHGEWMK
jgi:hypothetical protein